MKAWVLRDIGKITYEEVRRPQPGNGEVLVRVRAAGICGSDIPRIYQTGAHRMPLIPGHEFSGQVEELGSGVEERWLHKRVSVYPLIPCRECIACRQGRYEMCRNYSYLGSRRDGGFAEYVAVPVRNLLALPDNVTDEAAAMLEPMAVAAHAVRRVESAVADTVVVCGLGTIGLLTVAFLRAGGLDNILVIGNKEFQRRIARQLGIPEENYCDAMSQEVVRWIMERTDGIGADVLFECVGKSDTFSQMIDAAAPAGKVCLVGNPHSDMGLHRETYWKILRNQLTVTGTWNSSLEKSGDMENRETADWGYVLDKLATGQVDPEGFITHRFPLAELNRGFTIMRDKSEEYGKILGIIG